MIRWGYHTSQRHIRWSGRLACDCSRMEKLKALGDLLAVPIHPGWQPGQVLDARRMRGPHVEGATQLQEPSNPAEMFHPIGPQFITAALAPQPQLERQRRFLDRAGIPA